MLANKKNGHGQFFNKNQSDRQEPTPSQGSMNQQDEQYIEKVKRFLEESSKKEILAFLIKLPEETNTMSAETLTELSSCLTEYTARISKTLPYESEFFQALYILQFYLASETGQHELIDYSMSKFVSTIPNRITMKSS